MLAPVSSAEHHDVVRIELDPTSRVRPAAQLRELLARRILAGSLGPGERLPPVRELAATLGIAPGTVARAYRELEQAGLLVAHGRRGTFVTERLSLPADRRAARLDAAATRYVRRARQLGASRVEAVRAVERAWTRAS